MHAAQYTDRQANKQVLADVRLDLFGYSNKLMLLLPVSEKANGASWQTNNSLQLKDKCGTRFLCKLNLVVVMSQFGQMQMTTL